KGMKVAGTRFQRSFGKKPMIPRNHRRHPRHDDGRSHQGGPAMTSHAIFQKADLSSLQDPRLFREFAYVGGAWSRGTSQGTIDVTNPADGTRVGSVPALTAKDTDAAIQVAHEAFGRWAVGSPIRRSQLLRRWH